MAKTTAKDSRPDAIVYDTLELASFAAVTLASNQVTGTVAAVIPLPIAIKIFAVAVTMTTVNGTAAAAFNICSGVGPQGGVGPVDPSPPQGYPPTAAQMAGNGNILFASDQQLNGASAPVVNTPYTFYPAGSNCDIIWPANSLLTLRVSSGASAANGVLLVTVLCKEYDIHPYLPNGGNPFSPTAAIL